MSDTLDDLIVGLQNYVVAPLQSFGAGGYVFDVQGESRAVLTADITDHYTEDNKAIQDHIAIKPVRITLKGYVGEVVFNGSGISNTVSILQKVTQKLTVISAFLPQLSSSATQIQQTLAAPGGSSLTLNSIQGALPAAANIYGLVQNLLGATGNQSKQQNAYNYFAACQSQGVLMGIQTPWSFLTNMVVETIDVIQPDDSIFISDFSITFKQIRIAQTQILALLAQGIAAMQGAEPVSQGIVPGLTLPSEVLSGLGPVSNLEGAHSLLTIPGLKSLFTIQ